MAYSEVIDLDQIYNFTVEFFLFDVILTLKYIHDTSFRFKILK